MQVTSQPTAASLVQVENTQRSLSGIAIGEQREARVILIEQGNLVTLQLADRQLQIRSALPLQPGQSLILERTSANQILLLTATGRPIPVSQALTLQPGLQLPVEISQILSGDQVLVRLRSPQPGLPDEIQLDISRLRDTMPTALLRSGSPLLLEILRTEPLSVAVRPAVTIVETLHKQLLSQFVSPPPTLRGLFTPSGNALSSTTVGSPVQTVIRQLVQSLPNPMSISEAGKLQQAIQHSGVFLESQLSQQQSVSQDFKGNLLRLTAAVEQAIQQQRAQTQTLSGTLPVEVRDRLIQLLSQPQLLNTLPTQFRENWLKQGQAPIRLLTQLLGSQLTAPMQGVVGSANTAASGAEQAVNAATELARLQLLLRETGQTLSRIQLNQLTMVREAENTPTGGGQPWLLDIPVRDKQQLNWVQLYFQQGQAESDQQDNWEISVNLDTAQLGRIQANLSLQMPYLKLILIAETTAVVDLLTQDLAILQTRLTELGLTVTKCTCRKGHVDWLDAAELGQQGNALVDITI
ncbi:Molecular chaperone [Methylophaga frappieri]|uniref:Molecular chaperone n=1 Tax=Methylophaga frappieri (strain ATCC BAA-2434 / DSM 25690 / JAM7) TaxID=754477 RepID=I1YHN3_METFJ|nr:flagellar hook-length control protein FliK [Methylophaga frappieri]AFJ02426.1 Molecular chaperone [Methylophaga frappieri]